MFATIDFDIEIIIQNFKDCIIGNITVFILL